MINCKECGGIIFEDEDPLPIEDTWFRDNDGRPILKTEYPQGFCNCHDKCELCGKDNWS